MVHQLPTAPWKIEGDFVLVTSSDSELEMVDIAVQRRRRPLSSLNPWAPVFVPAGSRETAKGDVGGRVQTPAPFNP